MCAGLRLCSARGDSYCLAACTEDGDCESQASCRQLEVAPDVSPNVCVPHTLNCGQICLPDALDEAEEGVGESVTLLTEWSYDALTACVGDVDRYRFRLSANDGLLVRVQATGRAGYLDLEHIVEDGGTPQMTQSQSNGTEELFFACSDEVRDVEFQIRSLNGTDVTYDLDLELANERCAQACIPDRFEGDPESDLLELPFLEALTICRDDVDRLSFFVEEGRTYRVEFQGPDGRPQLKYRVDLDERLAEWRRADIQPIYEFGAPRSTTVELVIEAQGLEHVGAYEVAVRESVLGGCDDGAACGEGERCLDGVCLGPACQSDNDCGEAQLCVTARVGESPQLQQGVCRARCRSDRDCQAGAQLRCKTVAEQRSACLASGPQELGMQCARHVDCFGRSVCLNESGGYCAILGCGAARCPGASVCYGEAETAVCRQACMQSEDCRTREGYACVGRSEAAPGACVPR